MVRTAILSVAAACTLFALIGCNNRAEVDALQPAQAAELKPMQQSWRGVLPCADCEGIETSLFLEKDGTWVMNERYQGVREEPSSFASYGTWARTADKLVLTDSNGEKSYYRAKGNALEMLDREGNPVASQLNYTLVPVTASLPVTPMPLRGMYTGPMRRPLPIARPENGCRSPVTPSLSAAIWRRKVKRKNRCC
ncbi:copper homeostasis protein CutF [Salmonella enterica subsp. enterica serovar Typhi]|nr:NlpE-like protein [Salmonella enterica]CGP61962.1 copper homeostasis protein CutF [Salmonella enterica subsp. enterica serovar Typhi]SUH62674.1 copper homeostasis protein CutF [Salmonella enterica subsp. enterica serovar Choleraesuis]